MGLQPVMSSKKKIDFGIFLVVSVCSVAVVIAVKKASLKG